jgi:uncharacterized repeat protein (TIGR03803 family)
MRRPVSTLKAFYALLVVAITLGSATLQPAQAQTEKILHSFNSNGTDGTRPLADLILDTKGNLYGTTSSGGSGDKGTVFKLTSSGSETILHNFDNNGTDGVGPEAGLVRDTEGNLYGTTGTGGTYNEGTVFEVTATGTETILHSFDENGTDGAYPAANLVRDAEGNLYATTVSGGIYTYYGTVFELAQSGTETVLHSFGAGSDGSVPLVGLVRDTKGNLYGTTYEGGAYGLGTVFEVTSSGTETILHSFNNNGLDGYFPSAALVLDGKGNLYGTTHVGGTYGYGAVFELTPSGTETILHNFDNNGIDGYGPDGGLVMDTKGNLYGTTEYGGAYTFGTVFELTPSRTETVLHSFGSGSDGRNPVAGLVRDTQGNLYGTTEKGGTHGGGTVFEVKP